MNTRTLLAAALAALLFPFVAPAQETTDPPVRAGQDTTSRQLEQATAEDPWGEAELPPPVNPEPAPEDPRVPTAEQLEHPMATPPEPDVPPPDVDRAPLDPAGRWGQLDADGDGRISAEEGRIDADFHSSFEMMDTDSDGFIDHTELERSGNTGGGRGNDAADEPTRGDGDGQAVDSDDHTEGAGSDPVPEEGD
ncbi:hypothetical protein LY625_05235 [Lysobacter sp. GX 14042]|uniref:hypothetical protein n=1 Tax=Lysobacter sp. GX 14042 TaxID=2907155 RepID=UPI001F473A4D|nr:hypothetical protein [Lysobacter sp. GX 14042]MCE7032025.1 hypothetical protein [Lysobacter sp. GX 14042]